MSYLDLSEANSPSIQNQNAISLKRIVSSGFSANGLASKAKNDCNVAANERIELNETAESGVDKVISSCEKNPSVHKAYTNFLRQRKTALDAPLHAVSLGRYLLPQCALDATGFLSDVYKKGTQAKKFLADDVQGGKSMIEMLGVLAIVGVLSVGGIAGYSKAMEKYKVNKLVDEYTDLMFGLLQHIDTFTNFHSDDGNPYIAETLRNLDLVPATWKSFGNNIYDSAGNAVSIYVRAKRIVFDLHLGVVEYNGNSAEIQSFSNQLCFELFKNMLQPMHSSLYSAGLWKSKTLGVGYYGDIYCGTDGHKCLNNVTLSDMQNFCNSCSVKQENCVLTWEMNNI